MLQRDVRHPRLTSLFFYFIILKYDDLMSNRAEDWLKQAERDLKHAEDSRDADSHEWACFASQQAAEKAVKALHLYHHQEAWGHVVGRLLSDLADVVDVPAVLLKKAQVLDNFYIPPRYPNSHAEGAPFEHFNSIQSGDALEYAGEIIKFVRSEMA